MAQDPRRFDDLVHTVASMQRQMDQLQSTLLQRLATHVHTGSPNTPPPPPPADGGGTTGGGTTGGTTGGSTGGGTTGSSGTQTLGVGGIATPAAGSNVFFTTANSPGTTLHITAPGIYDGLGHIVGKILVECDDPAGVVVQNFYSRGATNSGAYLLGSNITLQNCDVAQVSSDGDANGVTFFGDNTKILYNAIGKSDFLLAGDPLGAHLDGVQTWNTPSKRSSSNVTIKGNWIDGPALADPRHVHQGAMAEGADTTDGGGGGTGVSQNWLVEANFFRTFGNQCLKFDDIHGVTITKNTFAGACNKIVATGILSTGIVFLSDNVVTGSYPQTVGD